VWTAQRKESGLVVDEWIDLCRGANDHVIVTDIRRREEKITSIDNDYDQKYVQSAERPARKLNWQSVIRQCGIVLSGDLNAQSSRWDPKCCAQWKAAFCAGVIVENALDVG